MNWRKVGSGVLIAIGALGSLAAVINIFATPVDVQHWLTAIGARVSPEDLLTAATFVTGALLSSTAAFRLARIRRLELQAVAVKAREQTIIEMTKKLEADAEARGDPSKIKPRIKSIALTTSSPKRGIVKVEVIVPYDGRRPLTLVNVALESWRFDGQLMPRITPDVDGVGTQLEQPEATVKFELQVRGEEEIQAILNALRVDQNTNGTEIAGYFCHNVKSQHVVSFSGALILRVGARNLPRIPLPTEAFEQASLQIGGIKNPWPPKRNKNVNDLSDADVVLAIQAKVADRDAKVLENPWRAIERDFVEQSLALSKVNPPPTPDVPTKHDEPPPRKGP